MAQSRLLCAGLDTAPVQCDTAAVQCYNGHCAVAVSSRPHKAAPPKPPAAGLFMNLGWRGGLGGGGQLAAYINTMSLKADVPLYYQLAL